MTAHLVTANAYLHEMAAPAPGGQAPDWVQLLPAPDDRGLCEVTCTT